MTSLAEKLLLALERKDIHLSPNALKLAETNMAIPRIGTMNEEWTIASFYAALKVSDCAPISLNEFVELLNKDPEVAGLSASRPEEQFYASNAHTGEPIPRYNKRHIARLYTKILAGKKNTPRICNIQPTIYVRKIAEQLYLPPRTLGYASRLSEKVIRKKLHRGRNPSVVAAVIIELTNEKFNLRLSKKEIADAAGCSYVSIGNAKRILATKLEE